MSEGAARHEPEWWIEGRWAYHPHAAWLHRFNPARPLKLGSWYRPPPPRGHGDAPPSDVLQAAFDAIFPPLPQALEIIRGRKRV